MVIEESDFKLEYDEGCSFFDLYLMHTVNAKDESKKREELKLKAYSITLESAINHIIKYRLNKRLDVTDLKTYISEYKNECRTITEIFGEYKLDK